MENILSRIIKINIYVLVFLIPLFFLPFTFEAFEYNKQLLMFFLVSLAFFAWLAKMVIYDREIRFRRSPLDVFVLAFMFVAILSAIFSVDKGSSLFGFYVKFSDGLVGLLSLGALYFLITNNVSAKKEESDISMPGLLKTFSWSVFGVVLLSYLSVFGGLIQIGRFISLPAILTSRLFNTVSGTFDGLAVFLAVAAVFFVGQLLTSKEKSSILRYLFLASIVGLLVIIDSTPAWLILITTLTLFVVLSLWKRVFRDNVNRLLVPIFLIVIAGAGISLQPVRSVFGESAAIANLPKEVILDQQTSWKIGLGGATESVKSGFIGSGIGTFFYDFTKEKPSSINQTLLWQVRFDRAGSYLAEILATMGFLGMLSYLALLAIFFIISYLFLKEKSESLFLLMFFTSLFVSQIFYYQNTTLAFLFWLVLGLSVISWQKPIKEKQVSFKDFPELNLVFSTLVILCGVFFAVMYFFNVKYYMADMNYARGQRMVVGQERTAYLEQAVRLNPSRAQYRIVLARAYIDELSILAVGPQTEQNSARIPLLMQAGVEQALTSTNLSPNRASIWEVVGKIYRDIRSLVREGAKEASEKAFKKAIDLDSNNPALYTELGKLYVMNDEPDNAKEQFSKALALKPDHVDTLIQNALFLEREGDSDGAIEKIQSLLVNYPYNVELSFQLGRLYFNKNMVTEAINRFNNVIALSPNHSNALYSLGVAYAAKGEKALAIQAFERVLQLNPGNQDVQSKIEQLR
ncbi:MAG: tetratricopeptide repeat protein [Candidatus Nealsonbacteria bacterium]|nr:tetratricopeptide repeat protein [Candidatus Nealsonbacteria bacterium]